MVAHGLVIMGGGFVLGTELGMILRFVSVIMVFVVRLLLKNVIDYYMRGWFNRESSIIQFVILKKTKSLLMMKQGFYTEKLCLL